MTDLLAALLLGIIEGITEFLPISSTGHLLIAERWLGHRSDLFNIAIQAGAILAVVLIYRQRLWDLAMGFLGRRATAEHSPAGMALTPAQARDYAFKLAVAFGVTAVLGVIVKKLGFELPDQVDADRLGAGARRRVDDRGRALRRQARGQARRAQPRSPGRWRSWSASRRSWPACSRARRARRRRSSSRCSPAPPSRAAATEFAFLVGIPTMFAATAYELMDVLGNGEAAHEDWSALAVAFVASAITAFVAVKWLLHYIQSHRFTAFAIYRFVLGAALLLLVPTGS